MRDELDHQSRVRVGDDAWHAGKPRFAKTQYVQHLANEEVLVKDPEAANKPRLKDSEIKDGGEFKKV